MRARDICVISLISLTVHLFVLSVFSVSIRRAPDAEYLHIFFGAGLLDRADFTAAVPGECRRKAVPVNGFKFRMPPAPGRSGGDLFPGHDSAVLKPAPLPVRSMKIQFSRPERSEIPHIGVNQPLLMYPMLPGYFPLYFKDREKAHIGLSFRITPAPAGGREYIEVKRKISCGNLEVDLIVLRQVEYYLLLQRRYFQGGKWHNVNIDFSPSYDNS